MLCMALLTRGAACTLFSPCPTGGKGARLDTSGFQAL